MFANPGAAWRPESQRAKRHCFSFHSRWSHKNHSSKKYGSFVPKNNPLGTKRVGGQVKKMVAQDKWPHDERPPPLYTFFCKKKNCRWSSNNHSSKNMVLCQFFPLLKDNRWFQYNFRLCYNLDNSFKTLWHSIICLVDPSILP